MTECPECGREFDGARGFATHWGKAHEGPTPESIDTSYGPLSDETRQKMSEAKMGEKNAFYGETHTEEVKEMIGERDFIELPEQELRRLYVEEGHSSGELADRYGCSAKTVRRRLEDQGIEIQPGRYGHKIRGENNPWHNVTGEDHPLYEGGVGPYPGEFNDDLKELIRQLYARTCQLCGTHVSELENDKLDVHHMNADKTDLHWSNLYPFCRSCHMMVEQNPMA